MYIDEACAFSVCPRTRLPADHTKTKATTAQSIEFLIALDAVAPIYMPSHVNAAQPTTGISSSHGRYSPEADTTAASDVIILSIGVPAKPYTNMNRNATPILHTKVHFTV